VHVADRGLRRAGLRLLREAAAGNEVGALAAATAFASLLHELQAGFLPLVARCPGRTHAQRRNVFLRLLRVRNYMAASCHLDLGIDDFARMASYSPCHFIRAFNSVFGDTPHAVLVEQRLTRARRLVDESSMAITEIARASGFENRCAFSRSFKRRFGVTATSLRATACSRRTMAVPGRPSTSPATGKEASTMCSSPSCRRATCASQARRSAPIGASRCLS
jgi:AraC family transcriptional regulator